MCSYWKYAPTTRTIDLAGAPRILMIQSEGDPATAYEGALAAHQSTADHTRLVSVDNEGQHGVYLGGPSQCAERIGDAFLFNGVLPAKDKVCGTTRCPGTRRCTRSRARWTASPTRWPPGRVGPTRFAERVVRRARVEAARLSLG